MLSTTKITNETYNYSIMQEEHQTASASSNISLDGSGSFNVSFTNPTAFFGDDISRQSLHELLDLTLDQAEAKSKAMTN